MSDHELGPIKRAHDSIDLASIGVQGEPVAKAAARHALRFLLGTNPLFPGNKYDEIDINLAVSVTDSSDLVRARLMRPALALIAFISIGAAIPSIVSIVGHEYGNPPAIDQSDNTEKPDLLPTPAFPTVESSTNNSKAD